MGEDHEDIIPALGGFRVMNADGEWNDARQTLFAPLLMEYYKETGEAELFELRVVFKDGSSRAAVVKGEALVSEADA